MRKRRHARCTAVHLVNSRIGDQVVGVTINVNVGVLGHVDSGKTSLVKALSTLLSTAALDKHPQSKVSEEEDALT
jgi:translation elongation factor EF-Tu-like GTPase